MRHAQDSSIGGKMVRNLDLNFPPVECQPSGGTSGSRQPQVYRGARQPFHATGQQQGISMPSSSFIDLDLIEDDVVTLSSSRGCPSGRNYFRRNQPLTVILDEDLETNLRKQEDQVASSSFITCKKPFRSSMSRAVINCDLYPDVEEECGAKRKAMNSKTESVEVIVNKQPTFTCSICMDELVEAASTICGHIFCVSCTKTFIQTQKKCPTCRRKLTMKSFHRVYLPVISNS
ncbi:E3 ubiquitin-protein ligase [Canna indica]|uniref:E3 ubiquitin-protein ligase n=1 Tax=Canna indica TaxID=4628 RepID=A0AAQ3K894_9LILI|nr:E3 ubiquitin-protein ligase [Canna indica]